MQPKAIARSSRLQLEVLGSFAVRRGDEAVSLPRSKKTRALLAYLAVTRRRHRRERLCEMFWDLPDDPRAALRWSLTKLREVAGDALDADREGVELRPAAYALDLDALPAPAALAALTVPELERVVALCRRSFLEDLALPRARDYEAWRTAHAGEIELLHLRARRELVDRLRDAPEQALPHAQALLAAHPEDGALAKELEALTAHARRLAIAPAPPPDIAPASLAAQEIRYCASRDGTRIAYAVTGDGYPILKAANYMSHLQVDLESPVWRHWITALSARNRLVRYDQRGNGLSDRAVEDLSFEAMVADLESVADAAGLARFALLGLSQGCAYSVAYALRHPERVSHLILYGGYAQGWRKRGDAGVIARRTAMTTLIREGWGQDSPAFRQLFTNLFIPGATPEQTRWFNDLQRESVSPETAAELHEVFGNVDVLADLPRVRTPTLVLHGRGDQVAPLEAGRAYATGIPGATFVLLDSSNHILLAHEPAFARLIDEVRGFVNGPSP
jgi:pimeloyl-ACP methyl ester carboxylesterase/DNA-binding SARP family transcriptional activator